MSHIPDPSKNVNLTIDGLAVTVPEGTTILEAARKVNIKIPVLCNHPDLKVRAVCRLCVVECDGGSKLKAACSNAVAEGLKVVTDNERIRSIRRTILELILAEHPQACPTCVRNQSCELQALAQQFGLYQPDFGAEPRCQEAIIDSETLVRDMAKCVKCGRCVEACQEVQTVRAINTSHRSVAYEISTAYEKPLFGGPCVHCGRCADVCPVGALYEYDQTEKVLDALAEPDLHVAAHIAPTVRAALAAELGLADGAFSAAQLVTALKMLGVGKVYDGAAVAELTGREEADELKGRVVKNGALPVIASRCPAVVSFVEKFFPDLRAHLSGCRSTQQTFGFLAKLEPAKVFTFSISPCLAKKFECQRPEMKTNGQRDVDVALTVRELARVIRRAGLDLARLPEGEFEPVPGQPAAPAQISEGDVLEVSGLRNVRQALEDLRAGRLAGVKFIKAAACPGGCRCLR